MSNYCRFVLLLSLPLILAAQPQQQCQVELFIGDPVFSTGDGGPAINAKFIGLGAMVAAADGTIYVAEQYAYRIRKIDTQGTVTTIAGTGIRGTSGDGGPAVQAQLAGPSILELAPDGSLYFVDDERQLLRRITPNGTMETVYSQRLGFIGGILPAAGGIVYFTETTPSFGYSSDIVRGLYRLEGDGSKTAVAGGMPGFGNGTDDGVPALDYTFEVPGDLLLASNGDLVVRDRDRIMRIGGDGIIHVIVGNGGGSFIDGAPALQTGLGLPNYLAANAAGDLFISDATWGLLVLREGVIHRLGLAGVSGLDSSAAGVFFSQNGRVFHLLPDDTPQPIAGVDRSAWYQPGRPLSQSFVVSPRKMLTDSQDRLYYFDASSTVVSRTTLDGKIEIIAGGGDQPADNGVAALDASFGLVGDIALDGQDRLYLSIGARSGQPSMILRVELNGTLTVLAGKGNNAQPEFFYNQNIVDTDFQARVPLIAVTPGGLLLFQIRGRAFQVDANGVMTAGPQGQPSFMAVDREGRLLSVDGDFEVYTDFLSSPLKPFSLFAAQGASTSNGTYFVLSGAVRVARRSPQGRTTDLFAYGAGIQFENGKLAPNAALSIVSAIATNKDGDLFIADDVLDRVFVVRDADECSLERPYSAAVVNGASFDSYPAFSPGDLVSVFGDFLGGEALAYGAPGQSGHGTWQTSVGGLEVFVDDQPAPIIFARADQAAFVIPNEVSERLRIRFRRNGLDSPTESYPVRNASPGLFTVNTSGGGQAAALNQDSSINSPGNPAAAGSVIVLYLTGAGATNPPSVTGSLNDFPLPQLVEPVQVSIDFADAVVEFAGPAPGLVSGVVQVNARIPANTPSGAVRVDINIGGVSSPLSPSGQPVTISIQ